MSDPLDVLRSPAPPADPDPSFAARLRARLARAFELPEGVTVSDLTLEEPAAPATRGHRAATPYLAVAGAAAAIDWYAEAFGARLRGEPYVMPDGRIGHAELDIDGARLMLSDEHPGIGVAAPVPGAGSAVTIHLEVASTDAMVAGAVAAGAVLDRAPADQEYGRIAVLIDPYGHRWMLNGPVAAAAGVRHGDFGYTSLQVPDVEAAEAFYSSVLGWQVVAGGLPASRQVEGLSLHAGLWGGAPRSTLFCAYAVADVEVAVERIRAAGGTATEPEDRPYGRLSDCTDDQGVAFAVYEPPGGTAEIGPAANGSRHGDLAYVTLEVVDSERARAFYGSVLGWRFEPGRIEDGWQVAGVAPMAGLSGGHERATTVPMYRVDDVDVAVERVRAAGGTATAPERLPYGLTSTCTDDQGTRFYLGQLS
jgi:predicted enzyme related to lactoylglutathione lyase